MNKEQKENVASTVESLNRSEHSELAGPPPHPQILSKRPRESCILWARELVDPKAEYPQTQQEHRLGGTTGDKRQLHGCSWSRAHHCRSESGSSGPSWPPRAAPVPGRRSPSQPGSRTPSAGGARRLPASCGTEETRMWCCCTDGRRNGAGC